MPKQKDLKKVEPSETTKFLYNISFQFFPNGQRKLGNEHIFIACKVVDIREGLKALFEEYPKAVVSEAEIKARLCT